MSNELRAFAQGDALTVYAVIRRESDSFVWQTTTSTFVAWNNANIANYDVAMTSAGGDMYVGDMPTAIAVTTRLRVFFYSREGATPAITDLLLKTEELLGSGVPSTPTSTVGASACAFVLLADAKRHLEIDDTDTSKDDLIQQLINQASALFQTAADRVICADDYVQFVNTNNQGAVVLKEYPIIHVTRVAHGRSYPLTVTYTGAAIRALISINDDGVRLSSTTAAGTTTLTPLDFATYPTVSTLATAISAVSGWTASASDDGLANNLYRIGGMNAKSRTVNIAWPWNDLDFSVVNAASGVIRIIYGYGYEGMTGRRFGHEGFSAWPDPAYGDTVLVEYRAGFEDIPQDIQGVVIDMVSSALATTGDASRSSTGSGSRTITGETLGDYSYTSQAGSTVNQTIAKAAMQRVLGANTSVIDLYINHAVAGVV